MKYLEPLKIRDVKNHRGDQIKNLNRVHFFAIHINQKTIMEKISIKLAVIGIIILLPNLALAVKPVACVGVSKTCTKNERFDKTIDGQLYSCYQCKQTVCRDGGSGPIAGTETSSVCESKAPSGQGITRSEQITDFNAANSKFDKRTEIGGAKTRTGENVITPKKSKRP